MGWASEAFWRDLGLSPNVPNTPRRSARNYKEDNMVNNLRNIPVVSDTADLVRVCDDRHILGQTDKAIKVRIGQTLYGEPITTFYPKSVCQVRYKAGGGYDLFVPKWVNRDRRCAVGQFDAGVALGFDPLPF